MKYFNILIFALLLIGTQYVSAQSIVNIKVTQNPLFTVSTNDVTLSIEDSPITLGGDVVVTGGSGSYAYRWYTDAEELGTESTLEVDQPGEYYLDITDTCDCKQTVVFHISNTNGIDAVNIADVVQVAVFTVDGKLVQVAKGAYPDLSSLPSGSYIVQRTTRKGQTSSTKVLVN